MALEVDTKDCSALGDADITEMADLCADQAVPYEVGVLSKQAEEWVLCSQAFENGRLKGFAFYTLERIGGTPAIIVGLASIQRNSRRDGVLRGILTDLMHRAVMAFPDEDVVVGARLNAPDGFEMFRSLHDVIPRPEHKASGEERAWGRRFAKRYGVSPLRYADRSFSTTGDGSTPCVVDHESSKPDALDSRLGELMTDVDVDNGDVLIAVGWAMSEDLAKFA